MGKLIIIARYWNDIEWVEASLNQIEYWEGDKVYLCEGNWDQKFNAQSTDGTREFLENWVSKRENVFILDNLRENNNYRINQANQSNLVMKLADARENDWVLLIDCDHFYFKKDIDYVKKIIKEDGNNFDYLTYNTYNFLDGINKYYERKDNNAAKLPYKVKNETKWIPTCHPAINGKMYCEIKELKEKYVDVYAMHYALARLPERLDVKYKIGDRKSPLEWNGGIMMKQLKEYNDKHSEFAISTLERLKYYAK
jgi:hypothetical protein